MGLFGLGSFGEGLVKGLAEGATKSMQEEMERIEDSIKTASDIRIKRIVQDQDKKRSEAEKIVKALKRARANLGGVDNPQAAVRAASLLKQTGDLDAFNTLVEQISQRTDMDFNKYFGDVSKMSPAASDLDIAYSFVEDTSIPLPSGEAGMGEIQAKGILKYLGPDIDAEKLVEERTSEQMRMMDLGVREPKDVTVPSAEFNREAFKLDGMSSDDEFKYIQDKIAKGNLSQEQRTFYSERANQLAGNMGLDKQIELAVQRLNNAKTTNNANEIAEAQQNIMNLARQQNRINALKTGSTIEVLKLDKLEALEDGNFMKVAEINKQLLGAGAMSFTDYASSEVAAISFGGLSPTEAAARKQSLVDMSAVVNEMKRDLTAPEEITVDSIASTNKHINQLVDQKLATDSDLIAAGVTFEINLAGTLSMKLAQGVTGESVQQLLAKKRATYRNEVLEELKGQVTRDSSFDVIYNAYKSGVDVDTALTGGGNGGGTPPKVDDKTISLFNSFGDDYESGALFLDGAEKQAAQQNAILDMDTIIAQAKSSGKSEDFIRGLQSKYSMNIIQQDTEMMLESAPEAGNIMDIVDKYHSTEIAPNVVGQRSKVNRLVRERLGLGNSREDKERADKLIEEARQSIVSRDEAAKEQARQERPDTPVRLAEKMKEATTMTQWQNAFDKYLEMTGRSAEDVRESFPPPSQNKNRGGLMSKK